MNNQTLKINNQVIKISPIPFEGKLSIEEYENQLYNALQKIGVTSKFINVESSSNSNNENNFNVAIISWYINEEKFSFSCGVFETFRENFGACTQAIKEDVRHILRGIKDISLILKQYQTSDSKKLNFTHQNPNTSLLNFNSKKSADSNAKENLSNNSKNIDLAETFGSEIISENHAKEIISTIKKKYPNFSNFSYIPDNDRIKLEKAHYYLGKKLFWK